MAADVRWYGESSGEIVMRRDMLQSGRVVVVTTAEYAKGTGRDHNSYGFTMWMAGGGIRGGRIVGATDAIGLRAVDKPYHFRDIHNTILHQLGLDQNQLTYPHLGREERLTFLEGKLITEII